MTYDDYVKQASQQYVPQYNTQVNQLKSSLASAMSGYDKQTSDTNINYDSQVKNQNINNQATKYNYDTNTLGRGLGRSTILTSGLAGLDDKNTRVVGGINTDRGTKLGEIGANRVNTNNTYNTNLSQLGIDRDNKVATLARQLQQTDWDNNYKQQQLDLQKQQFAAQQQAARYAQQQAAVKASAASQAASVNPWSTMKDIFQKSGYGTMINWLQDNKSSLIESVGEGEYYRMRQEATQVQQSIRDDANYDRRSKSW